MNPDLFTATETLEFNGTLKEAEPSELVEASKVFPLNETLTKAFCTPLPCSSKTLNCRELCPAIAGANEM